MADPSGVFGPANGGQRCKPLTEAGLLALGTARPSPPTSRTCAQTEVLSGGAHPHRAAMPCRKSSETNVCRSQRSVATESKKARGQIGGDGSRRRWCSTCACAGWRFGVHPRLVLLISFFFSSLGPSRRFTKYEVGDTQPKAGESPGRPVMPLMRDIPARWRRPNQPSPVPRSSNAFNARPIVSAPVGRTPGHKTKRTRAAPGPMIEIQDPRSAPDPRCRPATLLCAALTNKRLTSFGNLLAALLPSPLKIVWVFHHENGHPWLLLATFFSAPPRWRPPFPGTFAPLPRRPLSLFRPASAASKGSRKRASVF